MIYSLKKIRMSGNEHGQLRKNTIYATLVDSDGKLVDNTANANEVGSFDVGTGNWSITPENASGAGVAFATNTVVYFQYFD
jgi:hypothetical protein